MKKLILLFCVLSFSLQAKIKAPSSFDAWTIKFALHGIADPLNPCIQLGVELKPYWNLGLQVEMANSLGLKYVENDKQNMTYSKYKVRAVWYYYEKQKLNMYAGIDFLFLPKSYDVSNGTYSNKNYYSFESAHVQRNTAGIFLVDGITLKKTKHLRIDLDVNAGIRITNIEYSNIKGLKFAQPPKDYIFFEPQDNIAGIHYFPHIGLGVRLGYVIQTKINAD